MRSAASFVILLAVALGCSVARAQDHTGLQPPERLAMSDTVQDALENNKTNASSEWVNPDTGNSGGVTPVRTFENDLGQPCREFLSTIIVAGREEQGYGSACRRPDGSWRIVSDEAPAAEAPPVPPYTPVITPPAAYYDNPPDCYYPYLFTWASGWSTVRATCPGALASWTGLRSGTVTGFELASG